MVTASASLWTLLQQLYACAGPSLMLVYPLYESIKAIESPGKEDDAQWLTYWVLFYSFMELGFERVFSWMPFWYTIKLIGIGWLVLPHFHGAAYIYDTFVRKHASTLTVKPVRKLNAEQQSILAQMSPTARNSVTQYINDNGTAAFDRVVRSAVHDFTKSRSPNGDSGRHWWSSEKHERSPTGESGRHWWNSEKHEKSPTGESGRHWWSSEKHERSPDRHEKGHHFHPSHVFDDHHSDRRNGARSPESKHNNWGWSTHFDGGM